MDFLIIDESKCKKDGICAKECPMLVIQIKDDESYPELVPGGEKTCLKCGHCVVVCPHGALSHKHVPIEDCRPIDKSLTINEDQAVQFLRSRRSIRLYKDKPVEMDKIQRLIEIGRYAPTGGNIQMLEWLVFNDKAKVSEIVGMMVDWMRREEPQPKSFPYASNIPMIVAGWDAGYDAVLREAPALVIASAPKKVTNGMVDVTLALSYFELAATTMGLGTCWAGLLQSAFFAWPQLKEAVGIPEEHTHHYPMMLGYPAYDYHLLPERKPPKITWR